RTLTALCCCCRCCYCQCSVSQKMEDYNGRSDEIAGNAPLPSKGAFPAAQDENKPTPNSNSENFIQEEDLETSSSSSPSSVASSVVAQVNSNKGSEIELLQAENTLLRLALEEAQEKLRAATNISGRSVRPVRSRSHSRQSSSLSSSSSSREPGNGGVAYAQMRRLLLKDDRFLRNTFLPFLNIEDFGRLSGVCRRLKRSTYDLDVIVRCVESGGVTDASRGLMWLIMVGMDTVEPSSRGVLGVVIRERAESPEEQYDRLHRAMNGTVSIASPVKLTGTSAGRDGDNGGGEAQTAPAGPGADSGKEGD
ncbi:unnamed protein product, partial [Ectocarpus sp. 12 AP-2014]